jgi:penicillin amidase
MKNQLIKPIFLFFYCISVYLLFFCVAINAQSNQIDPIQKSSLNLKGLLSKVEVLRDQWGINHIYAQNEHDLFFAQGYCAVKDRLFQFEIWRRQATGTTAEILGTGELKRDIGTRLFQYRGDLKKDLNVYHPRGEAIINAYVEGVNAYIKEVNQAPNTLPIEFKLLNIKPIAWTPEIVISRHQGLLGNITQELNLGRAVAKVGEKKVKEIVWFHPKEPNLKMDSAVNPVLLDQDILGLYNAYRKELIFKNSGVDSQEEDLVMQQSITPEKDLFLQSQEMEGSNNWIIAGSKTASGYPMLANDPHRKIALPSLRYMVHLVAPGWNVIGAGEPVIPGVSIGHNEFGAWGLTIFETDGEDLYVYDLNKTNLNQYWHKGKWVDMRSIQDSIKVKNSPTVMVELKYSLHGPITWIDSVHYKAYAVKAAWMEPGGAPYLASLRIDQATDWESFREACSFSHLPGENMIWADKKGNIGWQAVGIIPIRKNFSGYVPIPGDGRYEWDGYLPIKNRPSALNPKAGFFATANQNVTPANYTRWDAIGYTWSDSYRGDRINSVLSTNNKIDLAKMGALQTDYFSIPASKLVPILKNIALKDSILMNAKNRLTNWDFVLDKNSVAAGIYIAWEKEIAALITSQFVPASVKNYISFQITSIIQRIEHPTDYFGEDAIGKRDQLLVDALAKAAKALSKKLGSNMQDWVYGQIKYKHVKLTHPLNALLSNEMKKQMSTEIYPRGGNGQTPGSTGSADNQGSGASFRLLVDTKDWDNALMINSPGQSGNPSSPFYKNLFETWANDQFFPAYYSKDRIKTVTKEQLILQPF